MYIVLHMLEQSSCDKVLVRPNPSDFLDYSRPFHYFYFMGFWRTGITHAEEAELLDIRVIVDEFRSCINGNSALLTVPNGVHDMGSLQVKSNQKDLTVSGQILSLEHIPGSNLGQTETTVDSLFEYTIQNGHGVILLGNVLMVPGNFELHSLIKAGALKRVDPFDILIRVKDRRRGAEL
uniref:Uncharacterized protein n=1 Tax=Aegilops tauschii TaxID=37682 RepID=N1QRZ8_AEGTA